MADDNTDKSPEGSPMSEPDSTLSTPHSAHPAEEEMRRMSRRSFVWAAIAGGATYCAFHWLHEQPSAGPDTLGVTKPLKSALDFNQSVMSRLYSSNRLSPTFDDSAITPEPRVNGDYGVDDENFDPSKWQLSLVGAAAPIVLTLKDIQAFPKHEYVTELKCIEGWSMFVKWAGARFTDFFAKYPPSGKAEYVYMETPDGGYYVSIDMPAALHPQTLLCYEMNGKPLPLDHGAPLRLVIPHKYGIKNIKRIGTIRYASDPPPDYWAEQGYDYYAGL